MGADYFQTLDDMRREMNKGIPRVGIGEGAIIRRAIIDKNARIGSQARLINEAGVLEATSDDKSYYIRDGIIIIPKNAVIKDGTVI
jgi:glucose-1-phosphate adenylyltransferase